MPVRPSKRRWTGLACLAAALVILLPGGASAQVQVRLNTVGYLPQAAKAASVRAAGGEAFQVIRLPAGEVVLEGTLPAPRTNEDTGEQLAVCDFTPVSAPGFYRIEAAGLGASPPFQVAADVYRAPFRTVMRGMYLWRCGVAVSSEHDGHTFAHAACHLEDAYRDFIGGGHERLACTGGWHDAGDYNKYVVNSGVTVGVMFRAWEDFQTRIDRVPIDLPDRPAGLPEFLAEMKFQLDWLLTMQADDGSVYHKVSTKRFGGMTLPELETTDRFVVPWGSNATADFVAMTAAASRHFRPYDAAYAARCLEAARRSYEFLAAHPESHRADQDGFSTGGYDTDDWDDRLWAEAELWAATGDATVLAALESRLRAAASPSPRPERRRGRGRGQGPSASVDADFDWGNVKNLGLLAYLRSAHPGRDEALVEQIRTSLVAAADSIVQNAANHGYARTLGRRYAWGGNGTIARQAVMLEAAARVTGQTQYRAAMLDGLNHLLGRNVYGRSFVTGVGANPPMHPHDRRSAGDDVEPPWPGYLVGGPHPRATDWHDDQGDYRTNEIAINWNGALVYALASQLPE
ncbi:MAG TPA: glycoside hydrolase family 9 protein [Lacipirellulaceae bacterium]|nr:glycoside hydrolase family 9 protein [Lacipirellulaceae bacterium]